MWVGFEIIPPGVNFINGESKIRLRANKNVCKIRLKASKNVSILTHLQGHTWVSSWPGTSIRWLSCSWTLWLAADCPSASACPPALPRGLAPPRRARHAYVCVSPCSWPWSRRTMRCPRWCTWSGTCPVSRRCHSVLDSKKNAGEELVPSGY